MGPKSSGSVMLTKQQGLSSIHQTFLSNTTNHLSNSDYSLSNTKPRPQPSQNPSMQDPLGFMNDKDEVIGDQMQAPPGSSTPRRRSYRRRERDAQQQHLCSHCTRSFNRAEHLTRHMRTHTKEKPFVCQCGAAFTRRDLLTRHWRLAQHGPQSPPGAVTSAASVTTTAQLECHAAQKSPQPPSSDFVSRQSPVDPGLDMLGTATSPSGDLYNNLNHSDGYSEVHNFISFIDNMGFSAEWALDTDIGHDEIDWHTAVPPSRDVVPVPESPTLFSTLLPSSLPDNVTIDTVSSIAHPEKPSTASLSVTIDQRNALNDLLEGFRPILPDFRLPSRHTLTRYLISFFEGFDTHLLFIHKPTFQVSWYPVELTLIMCAAGAQYSFEQRSAQTLFRVSYSILSERLRRHDSQSLVQLHAPGILHDTNSTPPNATPKDCRGPWELIDAVKTLLIMVALQTWGNQNELQLAFELRSLLVKYLRKVGLAEPKEPIASSSKTATWDRWVQLESARRTKLAAYCYLNVHGIAYNMLPEIWTNELQLRLPCPTKEWQASSAAQWARLCRDSDNQVFFQEAFASLLQGASGPNAVEPTRCPLGNYILLHALIQRIQIAREMSMAPAGQTRMIPSVDVQALGRGLRSWTLAWQQAPESTLDSNNENGPVPFTSSALLGVAYVRLCFNLGPLRQLESRDPEFIASALVQLPAIEENDALLPALLYCTHSLSIPVRLGVDRVSHSQAFFWSVQHALSGFECGILLSKWLCGLRDPRREAEIELNKPRHLILRWVSCIVEEAYSVIDFDTNDLEAPSEPFGLGLSVLRIWSRFLCGNIQWRFVKTLGESLQKYASLLESRGDSQSLHT